MNNKEYAEGLRKLADWFEAHEEIPNPGVYDNYVCNTKEDAVALVRALGSCRKEYVGDIFNIHKEFGPLPARFVFMRNTVCTRTVIGTEEIPEQLVKAHTREVVKWDCHPVLETGNVS